MENTSGQTETEPIKFSMRNLRAGKIHSPTVEKSAADTVQIFFTEETLEYTNELELAIKNVSKNTTHLAEFRVKLELLAPQSWTSTNTFDPSQQAYAQALKNKFETLGVQAHYCFSHSTNEIYGFIDKASNAQEAEHTVGTIINSFKAPIQIGETWVWLNCTAACVLLEDAETASSESLSNALEQTMQTTSPSAPFMIYSSYLKDRQHRDKELAKEITKRIENKTCTVSYIPIYSMASKKLLGFATELEGFEYQEQTIDSQTLYACAEGNQLLTRVQRFVFAEAFSHFARWSKIKTIQGAQLWLQTGVGALADPSLVNYLEEQAKKHAPTSLGITVGNTKCLTQPLVQEVLKKLSKANVMLSVSNVDPREDNLSLFAQSHYQKIGLHPNFLKTMEDSSTNSQLFYIDLAQRSGTLLEANGVATETNLAAAQKLGATNISGPLLSETLSASKVDQLLSSRSAILRT